ncbi:unnamed protein product [Oppiella nova]|uniref:Uncharacterized protein n=1 Tax=Oppiella nova TaxID=334625 RepID=A0A7R9QSV4_9ACAR|nr:unnamed protein product [Oppiella nova]CAG2172691.1 unnamed protein product [Oppiella nova]
MCKRKKNKNQLPTVPPPPGLQNFPGIRRNSPTAPPVPHPLEPPPKYTEIDEEPGGSSSTGDIDVSGIVANKPQMFQLTVVPNMTRIGGALTGGVNAPDIHIQDLVTTSTDSPDIPTPPPDSGTHSSDDDGGFNYLHLSWGGLIVPIGIGIYAYMRCRNRPQPPPATQVYIPEPQPMQVYRPPPPVYEPEPELPELYIIETETTISGPSAPPAPRPSRGGAPPPYTATRDGDIYRTRDIPEEDYDDPEPIKITVRERVVRLI